MKRYDSYKDSGVEWIGEIPSHWLVSKSKFEINVINGFAFKSEDFEDEGTPVIRIGDLKPPYVDLTNAKCIDKSKYKDLKPYSIINGDLLLAMTGATIGKTATYVNNEISYLNQRVGLIKPLKSNNAGFTKYIYDSYFFREFVNLECSGSAQENIGKSQLGELKIAVPSTEEQTTIANYLDQKTTQIDDLIAKKERLIQLLEEERTAIINQAVTKGLDPTVPMKDSGIEWLGEIPAHWEVKRIKYIGKIISGYSFKSEDFTQTGVRVMKISNIQTMRVDWTDDSYLPENFLTEYERFKINKGDLVFALTRPIISTGIKATIVNEQEKILLNQRNAVLKSGDKLNVRWMYYMIFNEKFKEHFESLIDGTGQQPNISSNDIANINIPLPELNEQNEIVQFLDSKMENVETIISKYQKEIELLKEYKTALISEVVTGKVDVRDVVLN